MIYADDVEALKEFFGLVILNAQKNMMPNELVEEKIIKSTFFDNLENGYLSFNKQLIEKEIAGILGLAVQDITTDLFSGDCFWLGEFYISLLFKYQKSFSFLFNYFPIDEAFGIFKIYHEMDNSQFYQLFEKRVKEKSLFSLLLAKNNLSLDEISLLSGINKNSIMKYASDNSFLFGAGFDNIYKLSSIFNVPLKTFVKNLNIYTDSSRFQFDKENTKYRLYFIYYLLSYFQPTIRKGNYKFDEQNNCFTDGVKTLEYDCLDLTNSFLFGNKDFREMVFIKIDEKAKELENIKNRVLVLFVYENVDVNPDDYKELNKHGFSNIYLVNKQYLFDVEKQKKRYISPMVNKALNNRAKEICGFDFAL